MPGFFEAWNNLSPNIKKKHTVTVEGKTVEVTLQSKLEIMRSGEDAWHWQGDKLVRKPVCKTKKGYPMLMRSDKGYVFHEGNPYWPTGIAQGGYTWQEP